MGAADLAPHHAEVGTVDLLLGFVHVGNTLATVELCFFPCPHVIELKQRAVALGVGFASLVTEDGALHVKSRDALLDCLGFL